MKKFFCFVRHRVTSTLEWVALVYGFPPDEVPNELVKGTSLISQSYRLRSISRLDIMLLLSHNHSQRNISVRLTHIFINTTFPLASTYIQNTAYKKKSAYYTTHTQRLHFILFKLDQGGIKHCGWGWGASCFWCGFGVVTGVRIFLSTTASVTASTSFIEMV